MDVLDDNDSSAFRQEIRGKFQGVLQWDDLDQLWAKIVESAGIGWYLYALDSMPPKVAATEHDLKHFVRLIDDELHDTHKEKYCGIVYVDDLTKPSFIKVYDPNNLGTVCSCSKEQRLPKWIISTLKPCDLADPSHDLSKNNIRWWNKLILTRKST